MSRAFGEVRSDTRAVKELCPLKRRGMELGIGGGRVGAVIEKCLHDLELAGFGDQVHRSSARRGDGCAALHEADHEVPAAVAGCLVDEIGGWGLEVELVQHARVAADDPFDLGIVGNGGVLPAPEVACSAISAPWWMNSSSMCMT